MMHAERQRMSFAPYYQIAVVLHCEKMPGFSLFTAIVSVHSVPYHCMAEGSS